jgi:hypothetical protein
LVHSLKEVTLDPSIPTAVVGDFNLHHAAWALRGRPGWPPSCTAADKLIKWLASNALTLENDMQCPTHIGHTNQNGSVIDLTFWNYAATEEELFLNWDCRPDLAFGSDHNTITWTIRTINHSQPEDDHLQDTKYHIDASRQTEWRQEYLDYIKSQLVSPLISTEAIIATTNLILEACNQATSRTMPPCTANSPSKAKWWNNDCAVTLCLLQSSPNQERPRAHAQF